MTLNISKKAIQEFPFATFEHSALDLERGKGLEWLLTNGLGGYSSSTILGLNTSKYHGLLVSSTENLFRFIYLQKLEEEIHSGNCITRLSSNEFIDGTITDGWRYLNKFEFSYNSVSFHYNTQPAEIVKRINTINGKNGILVLYKIKNKLMQRIQFRVNLLVNSRSIYDLTKANSLDFELKIFTKNVLGIKSKNGYLTVYSDKAECRESPQDARWIKDIFYSKDHERGDSYREDVYFPAFFSVDIGPGGEDEFTLIALGYEDENKTANAFKELQRGYEGKGRILSSGMGSSILELLMNVESFVVKRDSKKTIVAGYHWFGEWGRDAMISLPGMTLINGKFDNAERIFEHFLNNATNKGIPSRFVDGKPEYNDLDSSLWLIDRLYQYMRYVGIERGRSFLHTYWWTLKDIMKNYQKMERNGFLIHKSGTWMDTIERDNAVEIQALWYNALRIMEIFSNLMEDEEFDVRSTCEEFERNFLERYWNGRYLNDCLDDNSLRPNQVIAISLDFNVIDDHSSKKILDVVERELLTPYGLRTLNKGDRRYKGQYKGDFSEREKSYHNGTVWPWLLGPYIKTYMRVYGRRLHMQRLLETLFEKHIKQAGIGTISEIFDGDPPHKPRGCISQSWSVAEPLRAYFEDVMGKKPRAIF